MITSSLTLSYAEAHRAELYRQAEKRVPTTGISARLIRRTAIGLAALVALAAGFAGPAGAASPSFDPPHGFPLGGQAGTVAVGDFNGDSVMDLAGTYGTAPSSISLWLGTGNAGDPYEHQSPDVTAGSSASALIAADFNHDGRDDLAVGSDGQSNADDLVSTFLGSAGGLVPGEVNTVRDGVVDIDVGDLNGDGNLDLAVANFGSGTPASPSEHVSVLNGDGGGHFAVLNVDVGCAQSGVAIADLVNDGRPDLGVACTGNQGARIFERDAGGSFAKVGSDHQGCGSNLTGLTAGHFDGDSKADLAVDCLTDRFVVFASASGFAPLPGPNDTQATPQPWFPVPKNPGNPLLLGLETEDVNSDGFDDVLAADVSNSRAVVADGRANGQFFPRTGPSGGADTKIGSLFPLSSGLRQVIAADVNEDGKRDLVAASDNQIVVRLNTTPVPGVRSGSSSNVGPTAATLGGIVNPSGTENANNTTYRFEYGTTGAYGETTAALPSGASLAGDSYVSVSVQLDGLAPETGYHYRIVASNGHGTTYGRDRTFRTAATPPQEQQPQNQQPGPTVDQTAPELALSVAGSIKRAAFLKRGIRVSGDAGEESTLRFELVGRTKSLRLARVGDVVLAERSLPRAAGPRSATLKLPKSFRRSLSRRFTLTIRVTATDAAGNRTVKTSTLKVR